MGVQRPAEHHYVRRRPPPEREADRWIEVTGAAGRPVWLDAEIWMRPVPVRTHDRIPAPLAPAVDAAVRDASGAAGGPATVRFLHESFYYELFPSAVGLDAPAFAAAAPAIEAALLAAGCDYVETAE
jgi:hypothetical protein